MRDVLKYALINSSGTAAYVIVIVSLIGFLDNLFGEAKTTFLPILMLMLFVFSAAFTGALVFGRPAIWYLNGRKKEALSLLTYTLGMFLAIIIIFFFLGIFYI